MKKRILFIINPISGTAAKAQIPGKIEKYLDQERFDYEIRNTEYAGHATRLATQAAHDGIDIVVAIGGDGTVNEVARALVHTRTALGIIPSGSGNGLARHLLIPLNVRKSIDIINRCEIHELDYGVINGYPFFCTCGMGFDAFVSQKFAETGKRGPITYIQKVLEEGVTYKPETYEICIDGDTTVYKAFLISCANASQYGNNAYIAPQASMSDGLMDVIIMEPFDVIEAPQIAIDMFSKTLDKSSKIKTMQTKHLHVHRSQPGVIHYDGDPVESGEDIDIHLEERGIRIIVNPEGDKSERQPNAIQTAAAELFNEINGIRQGIARRTLRGIALTKLIQKKIERRLPGI
jgi:YegS/Rv2252/BmrU family lipid kinase